MNIQEMTIADYEEVAALWRKTEGIGLHDDVDSKEGIANYLERNPSLSFVARENGKIVGAVLCGQDGRRGYLTRISHGLSIFSGLFARLLRSRRYLSSTYILIGLRKIAPAASKAAKHSR